MEIKDIISSGLLELYITGLSSEEETVQVEKWATQYPEIKNEIDELQRIMEEYALAQAIEPDYSLKEKILSKIHPDPSVKEKLFARIEDDSSDGGGVIRSLNEAENKSVFKMPSYLKWAAAACIALLLVSIVTSYIFYNKYQSSLNQSQAINKQYDSIFNVHMSDSSELLAVKQKLLQQKKSSDKNPDEKQIAQKEEKQKDNNQQDQNKEEISTYANVAGDKYSVPVVLKGTKHSPDALAKIFWMKNTGEVYVDATYLPQAPEGKQYQLWAIVNGEPVDAGMITTSRGTYKIQKMKSFGSAEAFAITLEKAGGSKTPTMTEMVVKAKI